MQCAPPLPYFSLRFALSHSPTYLTIGLNYTTQWDGTGAYENYTKPTKERVELESSDTIG